nr:Chain P, Nrf2 cyclic peptide,c[GDPEAGE] [synthetic construct]
GDPEAGE